MQEVDLLHRFLFSEIGHERIMLSVIHVFWAKRACREGVRR